jgi:hypothetical protein
VTTHLDPTLQSGLQADHPLVFWALEILYPRFSLRLLDGPGMATINGNPFSGLDPDYGALGSLESYQDGVEATAPHLVLQVQPPSNTAMAALCDPAAQGSPVSLWFGALNRATGAPIGTPYLAWVGDLDTATWMTDRGVRAAKLDCESAWDRFFDVDEGLLLTNSCHQSFWPGELGLEYVTQVQTQIPWGTDAPRPVVVHDVPNGTPTYSSGGGSPYLNGSTFTGYGGLLAGFNIRMPGVP